MALSVKKLAHRNKRLVFFKLDLVNAYNTQCREDALVNLSNASPVLASFLRQFYGSDSQYFFRTGQDEHAIISAREGIEQGDAAGPALFACGLKTPLDELRVEVRRLIAAHLNDNQGYEPDCDSARGSRSDAGPAKSSHLHSETYINLRLRGLPKRRI